MVLALTFGLSMDYEIFLLTRIRERFLQSGDTRDAVAYGVSTSARTITSAALIMIAVFVGFAFAGMPLVAELGVACAVAIAVDATVVRLVLVPALMAMFDQWNWWMPNWLGRILPSVDFEKPLPKVDLGDLVIIPDDISALVAPGGDMRMVVKSAAKLKYLAPDAITVADPLAFSGCAGLGDLHGKVKGSDDARAHKAAQARIGAALTRSGGGRSHGKGSADEVQGFGALATAGAPGDDVARPAVRRAGRTGRSGRAAAGVPNSTLRRSSPMETTNVQLPTGDRLQIPTGAETLRLKGYLIMSRNSSRDYAEFADLCDAMDPQTAAVVLAGMDRYYCGQRSNRLWVATQLVRRLADPRPFDVDGVTGPDGEADWERVRQRCLSVAVAMLEEAR